jgi:hypothetical protein
MLETAVDRSDHTRWDFRLRFEATEHYRAVREIERLTGGRRWALLLAFGFPVLLLALDLFLLGEFVPRTTNLWPFVVFPTLAYVLIPLINWIAIRRLPRKDPTVLGELRRTVTDQGVEAHGNGASLQFAWPAIQRMVETEAFFFLFYAPKCAYYLPKRLISDEDIPLFRRQLAQYLGTRARFLREPPLA